MEQSLKSPVSIRLNRWREKVRNAAGNIFSPPHLPTKFIWFFLLTTITQVALILMNYSPSYWYSSLKGKGIAPSDVFETSKTDWLLFSVVYLALALFCLIVFNYRWSFLGWLTAMTIHFLGIGNWLDGCNYGRWSKAAGAFCEAFDLKLYWAVVALVLGILVSSHLTPTASFIHQRRPEKKTHWLFVALSIAWSLLLLFGIVSSAQKPTSGWVPLELDYNPPPLQHAAHAYDTLHNKLLIFGGATELIDGHWNYKNQTWEWDGKKWLNVSPLLSESPSRRTSSGMAYDEKRDVMVLYGGYYNGGALCDTWEWDGEKWNGKCPPKCPGARFGHEMYYDPVRQKVVLTGGYDNKTFFNDAWEWDGDTWTKIEIEGDAPAVSWYALAYDPDKDFVFSLQSGYPGGTWTFQENHWTHLFPNTEPSNRGGMRLVYEPERKIFVTFGGSSDDMSLNDTWFFDGKNWNQFTETKFQPSIRSDMVLWYDEVRKHVMLFGGYNDKTVFNDTWELILPDK